VARNVYNEDRRTADRAKEAMQGIAGLAARILNRPELLKSSLRAKPGQGQLTEGRGDYYVVVENSLDPIREHSINTAVAKTNKLVKITYRVVQEGDEFFLVTKEWRFDRDYGQQFRDISKVPDTPKARQEMAQAIAAAFQAKRESN
jgi:hypothetical protein